MGENITLRFLNIKTVFYVYCWDKNLRSWLKQDEFRLLAIHVRSSHVCKLIGYCFAYTDYMPFDKIIFIVLFRM